MVNTNAKVVNVYAKDVGMEWYTDEVTSFLGSYGDFEEGKLVRVAGFTEVAGLFNYLFDISTNEYTIEVRLRVKADDREYAKDKVQDCLEQMLEGFVRVESVYSHD